MVIAGHPFIAKAYLRWLFDSEATSSSLIKEIEIEHGGIVQRSV
jgi:hypothetical protein